MDKHEKFHVSIYLHSLEKEKSEFDRLPNVFDLIKRYFTFILKSLKIIRDQSYKNKVSHSFIHSYFCVFSSKYLLNSWFRHCYREFTKAMVLSREGLDRKNIGAAEKCWRPGLLTRKQTHGQNQSVAGSVRLGIVSDGDKIRWGFDLRLPSEEVLSGCSFEKFWDKDYSKARKAICKK